MMPTPKSVLLLPPKHLSNCIAVGIFRDTRATSLAELDRFNYFPAAPLVTATYIMDGELRLVPVPGGIDCARAAPPMHRMSIRPPQNHPTQSWSPGTVTALTLGIYPDAWAQMGYHADTGTTPAPLVAAFDAFHHADDPTAGWAKLCARFSPTWHAARTTTWAGSDRVSDWSRHVLTKLAVGHVGRSARTLERRLKHLTGHTMQSLNFFTAIEDLHRRTIHAPDDRLADIAADAGYADQSHMGRAVRRATGFSPGKLNRLIATEEPFWCYRLLGERF
jgi:AraC-like DNA-binding protein